MRKIQQKNNSSNLVTKDYFDKSINNLLHGIRREFSFGMETLTEKLEKRFQENSDKSLTKLDGIAKELEQMREDRIIGSNQTSELRDQVDNHEKRIKKLEHVQQAA